MPIAIAIAMPMSTYVKLRPGRRGGLRFWSLALSLIRYMYFLASHALNRLVKANAFSALRACVVLLWDVSAAHAGCGLGSYMHAGA
jgi:hypothetical protein